MKPTNNQRNKKLRKSLRFTCNNPFDFLTTAINETIEDYEGKIQLREQINFNRFIWRKYGLANSHNAPIGHCSQFKNPSSYAGWEGDISIRIDIPDRKTHYSYDNWKEFDGFNTGTASASSKHCNADTKLYIIDFPLIMENCTFYQPFILNNGRCAFCLSPIENNLIGCECSTEPHSIRHSISDFNNICDIYNSKFLKENYIIESLQREIDNINEIWNENEFHYKSWVDSVLHYNKGCDSFIKRINNNISITALKTQELFYGTVEKLNYDRYFKNGIKRDPAGFIVPR